MNLNEFVYERMEENKELFTDKEWELIEENSELTKKIYMIGVMNKKSTEN